MPTKWNPQAEWFEDELGVPIKEIDRSFVERFKPVRELDTINCTKCSMTHLRWYDCSHRTGHYEPVFTGRNNPPCSRCGFTHRRKWECS